jgi:sugar/nucleoside kinase (ribokinase family)
VVHPRSGAAAATATASAKIAGPFIKQPKISTGAGDHFNAGFALGQVLGLTLEESLCSGVGTSGYYVRSGISPTAMQLAEFVNQLPSPQ